MRINYYSLLIPYLEGTLDDARRTQLENQLKRDPKLAAEAEALRWTTAHLRVRGAEDRAKNAGVPSPSVWPQLRAHMESGPALRPLRLRPLWIGGSLAGMTAVAATVVIATAVMQKPAPMSPGQSAVAVISSRSTPMDPSAARSSSRSDDQVTHQVSSAPNNKLSMSPPKDRPEKTSVGTMPRTAINPSDSDLSLQDPFVHPTKPAPHNMPLSAYPSSHSQEIASAQLAPQNGLTKDIHTGMPFLSQPYTSSFSGSASRKVLQSPAASRQMLDINAKRTSDQALASEPDGRSLNPPGTVPHPSIGAVVPMAREHDTPMAADTATNHMQAGAMQRRFGPVAKAKPAGDGSGSGSAVGNASLGGGGFRGGGFGGPIRPDKPVSPPAAVTSNAAQTPALDADIDRLKIQRDRPGLSLDQQVALSVALAKAYQVKGEPRMSLDRWQQALETTLQSPVYGTDAAANLTQQTLQGAQDSSQLTALQARLEKRRSQLSGDVLLARMLASVYEFTGDTDRAYAERQRVVTMGKASSEDWYQLGQAETLRGNTGAAAGAFQQALGDGVLVPEHRETARKFVLSTNP